jgi:predicted lysophospholipase L1 biosynthesis ABC-type transport system permease subunit
MFDALQYEFMRNALAAGLLASVICGIMGTLVVVNRIVFPSLWDGLTWSARWDFHLQRRWLWRRSV